MPKRVGVVYGARLRSIAPGQRSACADSLSSGEPLATLCGKGAIKSKFIAYFKKEIVRDNFFLIFSVDPMHFLLHSRLKPKQKKLKKFFI